MGEEMGRVLIERRRRKISPSLSPTRRSWEAGSKIELRGVSGAPCWEVLESAQRCLWCVGMGKRQRVAQATEAWDTAVS